MNTGVNPEDRPYVKKGGAAPEPKIITPLEAEDFEQVPIDLKQLASAKAGLLDAEKVAQQVAQAGITVTKAVAQAARLGQEAEKTENDVREQLRQILATHGVKADEFRGFDFDKGVVKIQRGKSSDASTTG